MHPFVSTPELTTVLIWFESGCIMYNGDQYVYDTSVYWLQAGPRDLHHDLLTPSIMQISLITHKQYSSERSDTKDGRAVLVYLIMAACLALSLYLGHLQSVSILVHILYNL